MKETIKKIAEYFNAGEISSPAYVFSRGLFKRRATQVKDALGDNIELCFSIKANPFLIPILPEEFSRLEVCSPGELEICKSLGVPPEKIIFSGVNKGESDVYNALKYGLKSGFVTAESKLHLKHIINALTKLNDNQSVPVLLRLSDESQFGIDENELVDILKSRDDYPGIEFVGLHYFTGTGKKKSKEIEREMARLTSLISRLEMDADYRPTYIEYGPGLGISYFTESDDASETEELSLLKESANHILAFSESHPDIKIGIEMGRFFSAPCGFYITEIVDTKRNDGSNYIIVDGGLHQLKYDGQMQGMQKPVVTHIPRDSSPTASATGDGIASESEDGSLWTICGSLCTTADVLVRNLEINNPKVGDYLIFHRTGAYSVTEGMSLFLSRDIPAVYILDDAELKLIRESIETATFNKENDLH